MKDKGVFENGLKDTLFMFYGDEIREAYFVSVY